MASEMSEEHVMRVKEIRRRLADLAPVRLELEAHLMNVMKEIDALCREKYAIEQAYVQVTVITTKRVRERSIKENNKPMTVEQALKAVSKDDLFKLIDQLKKVQEAANNDEEED